MEAQAQNPSAGELQLMRFPMCFLLTLEVQQRFALTQSVVGDVSDLGATPMDVPQMDTTMFLFHTGSFK